MRLIINDKKHQGDLMAFGIMIVTKIKHLFLLYYVLVHSLVMIVHSHNWTYICSLLLLLLSLLLFILG